ncbi:radical SAM protein [Bacteriovoracaceae bacterium]|nr:radical SAM protein [Bacteriovoracaceae bacterium]|tara:strand:+ start:130499 stop:131380 length:882 start_codon:yes stop_codon:yes gene_type:complete
MTKRFSRIYIEVTNICNLNCSFCPIDQRDSDVMPVENFSKIIAQSSPLANQVCLHLMGEPLAHPRIDEILKLSAKENCPIQITTNGVLLSKHSELIFNSKIVRQVNISLQSYMDNYPNKDFSDYLTMIDTFIKTASKRRPDLYINLRLWNLDDQEGNKENNNENEKVFQFFENSLQINIKRSVDVGGIKSKKIAPMLYLHFDSRFEWPRMELPLQGKVGRCNALKDHIAIHADGTVVPCCLDDQKILKLGNCLDDGLENILESKMAKDMKIGFENHVLVEELCQRCSYIKRFK